MSLHSWLGRHVPDLTGSHWDKGHFVTTCTLCGCGMVKLPGLTWQLRS
jgi:hypothetical protein